MGAKFKAINGSRCNFRSEWAALGDEGYHHHMCALLSKLGSVPCVRGAQLSETELLCLSGASGSMGRNGGADAP